MKPPCQYYRQAILTACLAPLIGTARSAVTAVDGSDGSIVLIATNSNNDPVTSIIDGTVSDGQSNFSSEIITVDNEELTVSDAIPITTVSLTTIGGVLYFQLFFDSQETGGKNKHRIDIEQLRFYVSPTESNGTIPGNADLVWDLGVGNSIVVNPQNNGTDSPQGNGADFALNIPVSALEGRSSDEFLYLETYQTMSDNGAEEWILDEDGEFFEPGATIPAIPETSSVILTLLSLLPAVLHRRR